MRFQLISAVAGLLISVGCSDAAPPASAPPAEPSAQAPAAARALTLIYFTMPG